MKRFLSVVLCACMVLGMVSLANAEAAKETINFYVASDLDATAKDVVDKYNASQDAVEVVMNVIPNDDYDDKMKVLTSGGSDIDCMWLRTPAQIQMYIGNGVLAPLNEFATAAGLDVTQIQASVDAVSDAEGNFYGLPLSGSCWMLWYNKDLFDAAGVDYPINVTWDEYADLCAQLTKEVDGTKYWGGTAPFWTPNLGAIATDEYLDGEAPLANTQKYIEVLHRMYVEDKSMPGIAEMDAGTFDIGVYFCTGNVYTMVNGDWMFRLMDTYNPQFTYCAAPLPVLSHDLDNHSVGQSSCMCVAATSTKKQAAYDFIAYFTTSDEGTSTIAAHHDVPTYTTDAAMAVYQQEVTTPGVEYRFSSIIHPEQATSKSYSDVIQNFSDEMKLYLLEEEDLQTAFDNFFSIREEILAD